MRTHRPKGGSQQQPQIATSCSKVFLGGLNPSTTERDVREALAGFGTVLAVSIKLDDEGRSKGFGFVTFHTAEQAQASLGTIAIKGRNVQVKPSHRGAGREEPSPATTDVKHNSLLSHDIYQQAEEGFSFNNLAKARDTQAPAMPMSKQGKRGKTIQSKSSLEFLQSQRKGSTTACGEEQGQEDSNETLIKQSASTTSSAEKSGRQIKDVKEIKDPKDFKENSKRREQEEKIGVISKHSKEFYPTSLAHLTAASGASVQVQPQVQSQGNPFFNPFVLAGPYAGHVFPFAPPAPASAPTSSSSFQSLSLTATTATTTPTTTTNIIPPHSHSYFPRTSECRIKFFTFPGRI